MELIANISTSITGDWVLQSYLSHFFRFVSAGRCRLHQSISIKMENMSKGIT